MKRSTLRITKTSRRHDRALRRTSTFTTRGDPTRLSTTRLPMRFIMVCRGKNLVLWGSKEQVGAPPPRPGTNPQTAASHLTQDATAWEKISLGEYWMYSQYVGRTNPQTAASHLTRGAAGLGINGAHYRRTTDFLLGKQLVKKKL